MDLTLYTLRSVASAIVGTQFILMVLLAVVFYWKNTKVSLMQKMIIGESINSPLELTLSQLVLGIFAGVIGSLALTYLGITFSENSHIEWLFMISIAFMLYKPRCISFSYIGALIGIISLISTFTYGDKYNASLDIKHLIIFIGIVHIIEGLLVMIDGSRGAIPVFTNRDGKIVGGFALNRYWALPIAMLIIFTTSKNAVETQNINTPDWWPILNHINSLDMLKTAVVGLVPFYGVIGYSTVTFSRSKRKKSLISGITITIYGALVGAISLLTLFGVAGEILALALVPLGYFFMERVSTILEEKGRAIYISNEDGICVLEVAPSSPAYEAGIRSGIKITHVNEKAVENELEIYEIIKNSNSEITVRAKGINGETYNYNVKLKENKRIGVVLVPKVVKEKDTVRVDHDFKSIFNKIKNRKKDK